MSWRDILSGAQYDAGTAYTESTQSTKTPGRSDSVDSVDSVPPLGHGGEGEPTSPNSVDSFPGEPGTKTHTRDTATNEPTAAPWTADEIDEAAEERRAIIEESTGQDAEAIARGARAFYAHICGEAQRTGCCRAPLGSYCATGAQLRVEYEAAVSNGVPFAEMPTAYRDLSNEGKT